ncbi:hypothetical protein FGM00_02430 [Aggregatimonas sangjinii]|uniref:Uncharacterized protein n=1 Tax=Aggregatimonas sangjinii TaxID=2583587 RepID=A0A5B7SNN7_9FLAO|nr:hypothetical protein [Aggregatimonas sangjinii]QCW99028.1 hypothetical protein FGM00_02430 [Aggregatimonas sangjinii]
MAPNKFEKHIKKQLEEREIAPSSNAWERLSEQLDATAPPSKKSNVFWYGVAASFIGVLIVSVLYFGSGRPAAGTDIQIVDTYKEANEIETITTDARESKNEEVVVENDRVAEQPSTVVKSLDINQVQATKNKTASVSEIENTQDVVVKKTKAPKDLKSEIIEAKIIEIVAAADSLELGNTALTNAEVDSLLRNAQEELLRDKMFAQNGSVDAMALLAEVEDELDKTFRDQIFDSLKEGFFKVRTAVADRNK